MSVGCIVRFLVPENYLYAANSGPYVSFHQQLHRTIPYIRDSLFLQTSSALPWPFVAKNLGLAEGGQERDAAVIQKERVPLRQLVPRSDEKQSQAGDFSFMLATHTVRYYGMIM